MSGQAHVTFLINEAALGQDVPCDKATSVL